MSGSNPGSTPNWADGYVPPASEWNAWWGFKLDAATPLASNAPYLSLVGGTLTGMLTLAGPPTSPLHACTKAYADLMLPLAGGTVTGQTDFNANVAFAQAATVSVFGSLYIGANWFFAVSSVNGDNIQTHAPGYYEIYKVSDGSRSWVNANQNIMILDPNGNLDISGGLAGKSVEVATITSSGDVVIGGNLQGNNSIIAVDGVYANASTTFGMFVSSGSFDFQFKPSYYWRLDGTSNGLTWNIPAGSLLFLNPANNQTGNPLGPMFGLGDYIVISDERTKRDITPARIGLAEILRLEPIDFVRIKNDCNDTGFSAQQVREVIPAAVNDLGEQGLGVSNIPIVAALVNAVKTLAARVIELEGRVAA